MIDPLPKGVAYPGRLPPVPEQWRRLSLTLRIAVVAVPAVVIVALLIANVAAGVAIGLMIVGAGAATATYVKNRTDRHNAAIDRGEISVVDDPHIRRADVSRIEQPVRERLERIGWPLERTSEAWRFDGGWILKRRSRVELAVVVGEDGEHAFFDRRWVTDLWAASEYRAGHGRDRLPPQANAGRGSI